MRSSARLIASLLVAFMFTSVTGTSATAQEKAKAAKAEKGKATITVLAENDKARAYEVRFKPGDANMSVPSSSNRVVRAMKGGTLLRTYSDGKTEKVVYKDGEVKIQGPSAQFTTKNVGKSNIVLYIVLLK